MHRNCVQPTRLRRDSSYLGISLSVQKRAVALRRAAAFPYESKSVECLVLGCTISMWERASRSYPFTKRCDRMERRTRATGNDRRSRSQQHRDITRQMFARSRKLLSTGRMAASERFWRSPEVMVARVDNNFPPCHDTSSEADLVVAGAMARSSWLATFLEGGERRPPASITSRAA